MARNKDLCVIKLNLMPFNEDFWIEEDDHGKLTWNYKNGDNVEEIPVPELKLLRGKFQTMFYLAWKDSFEKFHSTNDRPSLVGLDFYERYWHKNGVYHREGKPAIISEQGYAYYRDGLKHNTEGPAVFYRSIMGTVIEREWWIDGIKQDHKDTISMPPPYSRKLPL